MLEKIKMADNLKNFVKIGRDNERPNFRKREKKEKEPEVKEESPLL